MRINARVYCPHTRQTGTVLCATSDNAMGEPRVIVVWDGGYEESAVREKDLTRERR